MYKQFSEGPVLEMGQSLVFLLLLLGGPHFLQAQKGKGKDRLMIVDTLGPTCSF